MAGRKREPAFRMFASEYNVSNLETKGEEEYSPSYLITPMGAQVNRVYFVGVLTEKENIGSEAEPLWRARVKDPTGTFYLSAGSYQPEASQAIRELDPPSLVAVVGKIRTFQTDEGGFYVSVRPERVTPVSKEQRDYWILQSAEQTKARLEQYKKAVELEELTEESLVEKGGIDPHEARGIVEAISHYGVVDIQNYKEAISEGLAFILGDKEVLSVSELSQEDILDRPDEQGLGEAEPAAEGGEEEGKDIDFEVVNVGDDGESQAVDDSSDSDEGEEERLTGDSDEDARAGGEEDAPVDDEEEPAEEEEGETAEEDPVAEEEETPEEEEVAEKAPEEEEEESAEEEEEEVEEEVKAEDVEAAEEPAAEEESKEEEPSEAESETASDDDVGLEQRICEAIKELSSGPRGADYHEVQEKLEGEGVGKTAFEEAVNLLLDKGIIYEPSVNRINVVNY
jgi:RPA family protein